MEYMILKELPMQLLKLLIIDEVHLLSEERGAVIETIVARTLRQVHLIAAGA
jgi:replicative superfamily II helicase